MSWLDNAIGWFSPKLGAQRAAWKMYMDELRSYDAGDHSRTNANWRAVNQSA